MKIGILGGGQLGRMLALSGIPLGFEFRVWEPSPGCPASVCAEQITGDYNDQSALETFTAQLDVITYEFENIPFEIATQLEKYAPVFPPPRALQIAQDRLFEKQFFTERGIPVPPFAPIDTRDDLNQAITGIGFPCVLKTRRMGYDGKGQFVIRSADEIETAWSALQNQSLILEAFAPFERELSLIGVRARNGETRFYPLVENHHREGILRLTLAPAPNVTPHQQQTAENYLSGILETLDYVGVLAVEFFEVEGKLFANEMACRVHNSGHWSIEGAEVSQFENHLRAVASLPLGSTIPLGYSAMINLIGSTPPLPTLLKSEHAHPHLYGKEPRPGRKIGHLTLRADDQERLMELVEEYRKLEG